MKLRVLKFKKIFSKQIEVTQESLLSFYEVNPKIYKM